MEKLKKKIGSISFWKWVIASVIFRLILIYFPQNLNLSSRPEVSTPLTSFRRLAEGYWLKQSSMSPYAGSMYHGSPLLLLLLGPLTVKRIEGQPNHILYSLVSVIADLVSAMLIRATGQNLQLAYLRTLGSLDLVKQIEGSEIHPSGDVAALIYLCNPFTIVACVGLSTSPIENMAVILCLYGACSRLIPLAAFGWVIATHLSLYPAILIIPVIFLLGRGPDAPPWKLFLQRHQQNGMLNQSKLPPGFSWGPIIRFAFWSLVWSVYVLVLCGISLKQFGGLWEMFKSTYGFILTVEDLSPNIGVLWYFFAEVFEFFRSFFLIVFHVNILFMILPLAIRLHHRPCYLAFVYVAIFSMLKSYPSVGDSALYLGLLGWFVNEFSDMQFSLFLFCGYVGVSLLSPVMHNLWIWRGTGNANFYFATAMVYACLQIVLVVEGVSAMLNHERKLRRLITGKTQDSKSGLLSDSSP
ncbi:phosphatidylinositol glycan anchor biosynthesis class U protein-like isoform X1 [Hibiscus syriacus]|uniref:phosphatidylinositol glycan anchor biosynthesis class U protein-like isoform X1 n=1 Tax=Hibiscus syriacus TaxID=106335 RepID=UPI0019224975|nr:phosphatidylinositol glycan anchor biosynthesis class U protein-like isoform X1 [Hibiscus syriacus]